MSTGQEEEDLQKTHGRQSDEDEIQGTLQMEDTKNEEWGKWDIFEHILR